MSMTYLGDQFEIHGGGADLAFPHHEAERAQSEGATGERPFVGWWMHAGMLHHEGAKMSKSLGNLVLVRDLLRDHTGDAIRHYLVSHHYRTEVHYDADALARSDDAAAAAPRGLGAGRTRSGRAGSTAVAEARDRFLAAMDDDLDTPAAMAELEALARLALETDDDAPRRARPAGSCASSAGGSSACASRPSPSGAPSPRDDRAGRRPGPGQRPPRRGRPARGPGGLDPPADLGRGARHARRADRRRWPGSPFAPPDVGRGRAGDLRGCRRDRWRARPLTGSTQQGAGTCICGDPGIGAVRRLVVVILGVVMAGERQVQSASPTVQHAFIAAVSGLLGATARLRCRGRHRGSRIATPEARGPHCRSASASPSGSWGP